jgi:pyrroloquinoline quinone (PQQ) biosynthesis protein C
LNAVDGAPEIAQTVELAAAARELFASPASALGAMYAFEVQQPETAKSKLQGLKVWYQVPADAEKYFEAHSANWHESEKLLNQINALSAEEQKQALAACARMSEALWNGLTGIQDKTCVQ